MTPHLLTVQEAAKTHRHRGHPFSKESRKKISEALRGIKRTPEQRLACSGKNNSFYGRHHSEEWKRKMSLRCKGRKSSFLGHHHTEETKMKMSQSRRGPNSYLYGKHLSPQMKEKISKQFRALWQIKEYRQKHEGQNHHSWKGGMRDANGYQLVYLRPKTYGPVHRIIVENILGRPLKKIEVVHHINGNRKDNRNENLLVCTKNYHTWLHRKLESLQ